MSHKNSFSVSRFRNRNNVFSWRVDGQLNGVRIRRNFKTQEEAAAEKSALELKALQMESNLRSVTTCLTEEQVRHAEIVFSRLPPNGRSLGFYVEYALSSYKEPLHQKMLADAVTEYKAAKAAQEGKGLISPSQLTTINRHMTALVKKFPGVTVNSLNQEVLTSYFERGNVGLKTYNNRRGLVSTFLKYAENKEWIAENPMKKIPHHRIARRRGSAKTLTATKARELMAYVGSFKEGRLVPYFALCLFAGIRPCLRTGEILRLKPEHINIATEVIHIEPEVSKVREKRKVVIPPNLAAWLKAYPLDQYPIIVPNLQKYREKIATLFALTHDVMRHTFISMHVAKFRSIGEAALQAGNSEAVIRKHYLDLKGAAEAEEFFSIMPTHRSAPGNKEKPTSVDAQQVA